MTRFKRTEMFMRIQDSNGEAETITSSFVPVSEHIGKPSPYRKPLAIAAIAVTDSTVLFSLLHPTNKNRSRYTEEVAFPNPALSRLERKAADHRTEDPTVLYVTMGENTHTLSMSIDSSGLVHLSDPDNATFEITRRGVMFDAFFYSAKVKRQVAFTFTGYFGRPDQAETVVRAVAMAINSLSALADFRTVTGISHVDVPAPVGKSAPTSAARSKVEYVERAVPVWLYREDNVAVGGGTVTVWVDLLNANPSLPVLLCRYTPSEDIAEVFHAYTKELDRAISSHLNDRLGADFVERIVCDIVLGDVDTRTVDAVTEALSDVEMVQMTPSRSQIRTIA